MSSFSSRVSDILPGKILMGPYPWDYESFSFLASRKVTRIINCTLEDYKEALDPETLQFVESRFTVHTIPIDDVPRQSFTEYLPGLFSFLQLDERESSSCLASMELTNTSPEQIVAHYENYHTVHSLFPEHQVIYIHCLQGISRSAAILISVLMRALGLSLQNAMDLVRRQRSVAKPNHGFVMQLLRLEESWAPHHFPSFSIDEYTGATWSQQSAVLNSQVVEDVDFDDDEDENGDGDEPQFQKTVVRFRNLCSNG